MPTHHAMPCLGRTAKSTMLSPTPWPNDAACGGRLAAVRLSVRAWPRTSARSLATALLLGAVCATAQADADADAGADTNAGNAKTATLPVVEISDRRIGGALMPPTRQVTVMEGQDLASLQAGSASLGTLLAQSVPGLSDHSRQLSDWGMTLRGRNALVLVDGIPLNTNRDTSRNLANINAARISKIEVMHGSSAIYGSGAAGGIISVTTHAQDAHPHAQTTVGVSAFPSKLQKEGLGGEIRHSFGGQKDSIDYEFGMSAKRTAGAFDGHGLRIAPDASQGDLFDSNTWAFDASVGIRLDAQQKIRLAASHLRASQHTAYASDPAVNRQPVGSALAQSMQGLELERQNQLKNSMLSLAYENQSILGGSLSAMVYGRDNFNRFSPFDARSLANRGNHVDQVMQNNRTWGARLTLDTPIGQSGKTRMVWGADYLQEKSNMPLDIFDAAVYDASQGRRFRTIGQRIYMPWTTTRSAGAFAQLRHRFGERWSAEAGLRHERAQASFGDFQPLSQSRLAQPATVRGGKVSYSATLLNVGASLQLTPGQQMHASFGQGFELPDVGLQLRNAGAGFNIGSSQLKPVRVDTFEVGWRGVFQNALATVVAFHSRSDLGAVQSLNNGLHLLRTKERIKGLEMAYDHFGRQWSAGATLTWMQGRETPQGGSQSRAMTGWRIPPLKITGHLQYQPGRHWGLGARLNWMAGKDYRLPDGRVQFGRADVKGYFTVDLVGKYQMTAKDSLEIGVHNLFDRHYLPLYSQLMRSGKNDSRLPAEGRRLAVAYTHQW